MILERAMRAPALQLFGLRTALALALAGVKPMVHRTSINSVSRTYLCTAVQSSSLKLLVTGGSGPNHALMAWKTNPMWEPLRAVTAMEQLPGRLPVELR